MKKIGLSLGLLLFCVNVFANTSNPMDIFIPDHNRVTHPHCTCDCDNKILYKGGQVTNQSLAAWAKEAATSAYTFGFGNYEVALRKASQYFTPQGWEQFRSALNQSGNLEIIVENKLLVTAIPAGEASHVQKVALNHRDGWKLEIPLVMKYDSAKGTLQKPVKVTMSIVQTNPQAGLQGLGVEQFIVEPRKA